MERTSRKCFRCGYEDHLIKKCPKPQKENEKRRNQVRFNEKVNRARNNDKNNSDQKIYASMARMSGNDECPSGIFVKVHNCPIGFLDSGATCHMTPEVSDFIPGSLEDTDKHIEDAYGHNVTAKQKGQLQIKICDDHVDPFITTLHNVLLAPDLCDRLFLIITSMNSGHTSLFHKGF